MTLESERQALQIARVAAQLDAALGQSLVATLPLALPLAPGAVPADARAMAALIDHTLLRPEATRAQLRQLCDEARRWRFAAVCVHGSRVAFCREQLIGTRVRVCGVVGFPLGACGTAVKAFEAAQLVRWGAQELDMVLDVGALHDRDDRAVLDDIGAVVAAARPAAVKVIIETALLDDEQKVVACLLARLAGAQWVKTSTGFAAAGATVADVRLMRQVVGDALGVKAAGGVRSRAAALALIAAGATRLGTSMGPAIVAE
ncbi:MAG: deoxyribose-phosphate aldolase [Proteobacteria bacterium]|nr:deoxyribose-phosphate aldolase [Pseudomonadota bacterium]